MDILAWPEMDTDVRSLAFCALAKRDVQPEKVQETVVSLDSTGRHRKDFVELGGYGPVAAANN